MRAALLAALLASAAAAQGPSAGQALFDAEGCRACHKIDGRGGDTGPDLTLVGFRHNPAWLDVWLTSPSAWNPKTRMPEFRLKEPARRALVEYLSSLTGQDFAHHEQPNGARLYARAGCVACHGPQGRGGHPNNNVPGNLIPALTGAAQGYTAEELRRKIAGGSRPEKADPSGPDPLVAMPAWGQVLTPAEINAVADYVLSLAPRQVQEDF